MSTRVDPSNTQQLDAWDGDSGQWWAANADRLDEGVAGYQAGFLAAAAIEPTERVLDIGCGNGLTTRDAARAAKEGSVLGVDLSARMLALARQRAELDGLSNVTFEQADAQVYPFPANHFDVAVSRNGAMFFGDPQAAFRNVARALRPGGRLVLLSWRELARQEWLSTILTILSAGRALPVPPAGSPGPLALSDPARVRGLLRAAGFAEVRLDDAAAPMYLGADPDDAHRFVSGQFAWLLRDLEPDTRDRVLDALRADLAEHRTDQGVRYGSAAWITQARLD